MTTRARLIARGLLDDAGNVTPAGERWTDEQVEKLRGRVRAGQAEGKVANRRCQSYTAPMKRPFWQEGYIYVADEAGDEIPGSRRYLDRCATMNAYRQLWLDLQRQMGEGCRVRHRDEGKPV